ncbi:ABC transporter permease [Agromyces laixinhei]|uniref:ABC transporter permease n=1 Tax=Agromyces laixinhei TaxID=2585717 RepID=UPI0018DB7978|nr:ABC transporter permease [Agromyces laixinhei]
MILGVVIVLFSVISPATFLTSGNFTSIASNYALTLILAMAVVPVLMVGQFDFSVTGTFGVSNALMASLILVHGVPTPIAIIIAIATGVLVGSVNALCVVKFKINSLITTLGTGTILLGVSAGIAASGSIVPQAQEVNGETVTYVFPSWFLALGQGKTFGVSNMFLIAVAAVIVMWVLLDRTAVGRRLNATGGNAAAARLSGVNTNWTTIGSFISGGALAAFAGVLVTSMLGSAQTNIAPAYLLPLYAGAYLGATTIKPGRFNPLGTMVGVYLIGVCVSGLQQVGVEAWIQDVFNGAALIVAVGASAHLAKLANQGGMTPRAKSRQKNDVPRLNFFADA